MGRGAVHQGGPQAGQQDGHDYPQNGAEGAQSAAQRLRDGEANRRVIVLVHRVPAVRGDGKDGVNIGPDEHKARVSQGKQARKAGQQV